MAPKKDAAKAAIGKHPDTVREAANRLADALEAAERDGYRISAPPIQSIRQIGVSETARVQRTRIITTEGDPAARAAEALKEDTVVVSDRPRVAVDKHKPVERVDRVVEAKADEPAKA